MAPSSIGRRYERLLFFAGPIAFACLLVMFVAIASDGHEDHRRARCLLAAADVIDEQQEPLLRSYWGERISVRGIEAKSYDFALELTLIPWRISGRSCNESMVKYNADGRTLAPKPLAKFLRQEAQGLESKPLNIYGVELPEKATLSILGTPIRMELVTMTRALQVALGPVLLLWLGSLYNTRNRESLHIGRMRDLTHLYPHLVNVYPMTIQGDPTWSEPKKRSWLKFFFLTYGLPSAYAIARMSLLSAFVMPPVVFYLVSIFLLNSGPYSLLFTVVGVVVGIFALGNVFSEFTPWHFRKRFRVPSSGVT